MRKPHRLDAILWSIAVRGPEAAFDHVTAIREYFRNEFTTFMDIRFALEDAGMERTDIMELAIGKHQAACACWPCVMAVNMQVRKMRAKMEGRSLFGERSA